MKEIGGYLQLDEFKHQEYYSDLLAINTARNALVYLCRAKQIKKIYIPYFLCDSVSKVCNREAIEYEYYHINPDFTPNFYKKLDVGEYLYIVNFYGQLTKTDIEIYKGKYDSIILDNVQAFFQSPIEGIDTIYSCRKFFGVPDGAYLATNAEKIELNMDVSKERMRHILGRYEGSRASEFYADFKANDYSFAKLELKYMSRLTRNFLGAIDYEMIKKKRNENYDVLEGCLNELNGIKVIKSIGPYSYPFYCKNGMKIKQELAVKKIFIPTLWPNVLEFNGCDLEKDYAENILPLPVDQRYGIEDMKYIAEEVKKCIKS